MKKKTIIITIALFILFIFLYVTLSIYSYGNKNRLVKADAAIVLGAASWGKNPSPIFKERINHAIWLYENNYAKKIIFTGGRDSKNEQPASVVAKNYALKANIPEKNILIETKSATTEQNLIFAKRVAEKYNLKTFLIVSDPLHMKRAMLIAKDAQIEAHNSPTQTTRYISAINKFKFLFREVYYYSWYNIIRLFK